MGGGVGGVPERGSQFRKSGQGKEGYYGDDIGDANCPFSTLHKV